jgi:hypothetical protein
MRPMSSAATRLVGIAVREPSGAFQGASFSSALYRPPITVCRGEVLGSRIRP